MSAALPDGASQSSNDVGESATTPSASEMFSGMEVVAEHLHAPSPVKATDLAPTDAVISSSAHLPTAPGDADGVEQPIATEPKPTSEHEQKTMTKSEPVKPLTSSETEATRPSLAHSQGSENGGDHPSTEAAPTSNTTASTSTLTTTATHSTPLASVPLKKFTSLNVNKIFLEKASPTISQIPASVSPAVPKVATNGGLSQSNRFASTSSASSRLTSAKLSTAGKPQQPSWASTAPVSATSPGPVASTVSNFALGPAVSSTSATAGVSGANVAPSVGHRLSTSLHSSTNRSASPRLTLSGAESSTVNVASRGSPGLRNATLGSLNRSGSPATSTGSGGGGSTLAPWANLKPGSASSPASKGLGANNKSPYANPDFPTAAEAAAVKKAQEEKEKAEAAEAAARHEQHLRNLDRFRGQALGSSKHWDEMEDEDGGFLDDVVQFADGTQYKVQASQKESEGLSVGDNLASQETGPPVTKEERFKDVDHDRSWPARGGSATSQPNQQQTTAALPPPQSLPRRTTIRETLDITSGTASLSLDAQHAYDSRGGSSGTRMDRGWGPRGTRGDKEGEPAFGSGARRGSKGAVDQQATSAVRAWGPLAVRQQSLNPDAPRPQLTAAPPPPSASPMRSPAVATPQSRSPVARQGPPSPVPPHRRGVQQSDPKEPLTTFSPVLVSQSVRAPPPHLALRQQQQQLQSSRPQLTQSISSDQSATTSLEQQMTSLDKRLGLSPPQQPMPTQQPESASPWQGQVATAPVPHQSVRSPTLSSTAVEAKDLSGSDQAHEMLSAAERARRRRQEEEDRRAAEKERARQKAFAIEERMKKEAEQRAAEAEQKRKQEQEEHERRRTKLREEEERRRAEAERTKGLEAEQAAAVAKRADNLWRPRDHRSPDLTGMVTTAGHQDAALHHRGVAPFSQMANGRTSHHGQQQQQAQISPLLSPSDGASSWRRQAPVLPVHQQPKAKPSQNEPSSPLSAVTSPQRLLLKRPSASAASAAEGMANLDDVMGRIRGAMQQQQQQQAPQTSQLSPNRPSMTAEKVSGQVGAHISPPLTQVTPATPSITRPPHVLVNQERVFAAAAAVTAKSLKEQQHFSEEKQERTAVPKGVQIVHQRPSGPDHAFQSGKQGSKIAEPLKIVTAELFATKTEPPVDQIPVWNKFKVNFNHSTAKRASPLLNAHFKAEKTHRALFAQFDPAAPAILTWEPSIPGLSIRTLSRDDQLFPRKYRKGTVITNVAVPSKRFPLAPLAVLSIPLRRGEANDASQADDTAAIAVNKGPVAVKLPGSAKTSAAPSGAPLPATFASTIGIPTEPASMRSKNFAASSAVDSGTAQESSTVNRVSILTSPRAINTGSASSNHRETRFEQLSSSTRPELDFNAPVLPLSAASRSGTQLQRNSNEGVAFAQGIGSGWTSSGLLGGEEVRGKGSVSPVNFMVHSELDNSTAGASTAGVMTGSGPSESLASSSSTSAGARFRGTADGFTRSAATPSLHSVPLTTAAPAFHPAKPSNTHLSSSSTSHSTTHTPLLPPSSGLGSATWGQGPLTFLEATPNARGSSLHTSTASGDQGRIKEVWARSDGYDYGYGPSSRGSGGESGLGVGGGGATHNSLRDIGDDFLPSTLRMSLNDFSDGAPPTNTGAGGSLSAPSVSPSLMRSPAQSRYGGSTSQPQQQERNLPPHLQQQQGSCQQSMAPYNTSSYLDPTSAGSGSYSSRSRAAPSSTFQYGHQPVSQGAVFSTSLGPVETATTPSAVATSNFDPTVDAFTSSTKTPYGSWAAPSSTTTSGSGAYEGYDSTSGAYPRPYRSYQPETTTSNSPSSFDTAAPIRGSPSGQGQGQGSHSQLSPFSNRGPAPHLLLQQQQQDGHGSTNAFGNSRLGGYGGRGSVNSGGAVGNVDSTAALWQ